MTSRILSLTLSLALVAPIATLAAQAGAKPPVQATTPPAQTLTRRVVAAPSAPLPVPDMSATNAINPPSPDPRVGLAPAAGANVPSASWNMKHLSNTPSTMNSTHSDLAFKGNYVIQGNYLGFEVWDITNPVSPVLKANPTCPASQDDISVYGNLLFLSAETGTSRVDCGTQGVAAVSSPDRMRGVRIFDISDIAHPVLITQVQSCRGSHTHTLLTDPNDKANIYVYISGTSGVRPSTEVARCTANPLDPNTSLFNIEIIKVPLANPKAAAVVTQARIFSDGKNYAALPSNLSGHGQSPADAGGGGRRGGGGAPPAAGDTAGRGRAGGGGAAGGGRAGGPPGGRGGAADPAAPPAAPAPPVPVPVLFVRPGPSGKPPLVTEVTPRVNGMTIDSTASKKSSDSLIAAGWTRVPEPGGGRGGRGGGGGGGGGRGGGGGAAAAPVDSLVIKGRAAMALVKPINPAVRGDTARWVKTTDSLRRMGLAIPFAPSPPNVLSQCHDITLYPSVGFGGGACAGMGILLDIRDPANPKRLDAVADTNFAYWHSATFSNDGSKVLFSDEWGGGGSAFCRALDPITWGGDAIFTIEKNKLVLKSYYKMPAPQTAQETCVAHNGNLIPIPGRDIMVQSFYQGGITVFEWTDPAHPKEIAFFDRGPGSGGFWSSYYYNGYIVGSEIRRGLDMFELTPSEFLSQNELDAAKLIKLDWLNPQDQPKFVWPANIVVVRSYLDQLVRWNGLAPDRSKAIDAELTKAMSLYGPERKAALLKAAVTMDTDAKTAKDGERVKVMAKATRDLAATVK